MRQGGARWGAGALAPEALSASAPVLLVLPGDGRVEQELLDRAREGRRKGAAVSGEDVITLDALIQGMFQHARDVAEAERLKVFWRGRRVATPREIELVVRQVVRGFYQAQPRGIFARFAQRNGFIQALQDFLVECRAGHVGPEDLVSFHADRVAQAEEEEIAPHRLQRIEELAQIFARYEQVLGELGLIDEGQIPQVAYASMRDANIPLASFLERERIEVRDIHAWTPMQIDVMHALGKRLTTSLGGLGDRVVLCLPYESDRPSLFHGLEGTLRHLESLAGESLVVDWDPGYNPDAVAPLRELAESLWADPSQDLLAFDDDDGEGEVVEGLLTCLRVIEAPGVRREARAVARHVRMLLDNGAAPEDIAIAVRTMDDAVDLLGDALEDYGVSWSHAFEEPLSTTPLAQTALQLLRLVQENYPRELFIEVLTGWATARFFPEQTTLHNVARDAVERAERERLVFNHELAQVLRSIGIRDDRPSRVGRGLSGYEERLDVYVQRQRMRVEEQRAIRAQQGIAAPEDAMPVEQTEQMRYVQLIRDRVVQFRHVLAEHVQPKVQPLSVHAAGLRKLLERLDVRGAVASVSTLSHTLASLDHEHDSGTHGIVEALDRQLIRAVARDLQALDTLDGMLVELERYPVADGSMMTLAEFTDLLANLFERETWTSAVDQTGGCVRVVGVEELCGLRVPHLILVGLNDGNFPSALIQRPLFTDEDRFQFATFERARRRERNDDTVRIPFPLQIPWDEDLAFSDALAPVPARLAEEALLFYFAILAATHSLALTYSTLDGVGRKAVRSIFVDAVMQLVPEDEHALIVRGEALEPVPQLHNCVAPWELTCRHALDAADAGRALDALEPGFDATALDPIEERLDTSGVPMGDIRLATTVELTRQHLATLNTDTLYGALQQTPWRAWSGMLEPAHRSWLEEVLHFGVETPLSFRQMDGFRRCPQQFFFRNVLHLRSELRRGLEVSHLDHSVLVHDVIEHVLRELEQRELLRIPAHDTGMRRVAEATARDSINSQLDRWEERRNLAHPQLWAKERRDAGRQVMALVRRVLNSQDATQLAAPWGFGAHRWTSRVDVAAVPLTLDEGRAVNVSGAVDRVVLRKEGAHTVLELVDYGTASADRLRRNERKELVTSYALPMAMLAAIHGLVPRLRDQGQVGDELVVMAQRESVMDGRRTRPLKAVVQYQQDGSVQVRSKGLERARQNMDQSVRQMWDGAYPFDTRDCAHCLFKRACRRGNYPELR